MPPRGKSRPEKEGEGGVASGSDSFLKKNFFSFINSRERGKEGENKGEKHQCERETSIGCPLHVPQLGTEPRPGTKPTTQACALTRN